MLPSDVISQILPYIKAEVLASENNFKTGVTNWLKAKGFLVGLAAPFLVNVLWNFIIGFGLSFAVTMAVNVTIALTAPYLVPFIPIIDEIVNVIDSQFLPKADTNTFKSYGSLFSSQQPGVVLPPEPFTEPWESYL